MGVDSLQQFLEVNTNELADFCRELGVESFPHFRIYKQGKVLGDLSSCKAEAVEEFIRGHVGNAEILEGAAADAMEGTPGTKSVAPVVNPAAAKADVSTPVMFAEESSFEGGDGGSDEFEPTNKRSERNDATDPSDRSPKRRKTKDNAAVEPAKDVEVTAQVEQQVGEATDVAVDMETSGTVFEVGVEASAAQEDVGENEMEDGSTEASTSTVKGNEAAMNENEGMTEDVDSKDERDTTNESSELAAKPASADKAPAEDDLQQEEVSSKLDNVKAKAVGEVPLAMDETDESGESAVAA